MNGVISLYVEEFYKEYISLFLQDKFLGYLPLWNKLFKKTVYKEQNLKINERMILGGNREFNCRAFLKASSIACINKELYIYDRL